MTNIHAKYMLVGGGLASSSAAAAIRAIDPNGELMLIGQEVVQPYHRPPLSKQYLRREQGRAEIFTQPAKWYAEQHVQLRTGRRVAALETSRRMATLDSGEEISFDQLLIATGASPRHLNIPGADLPNLFYLRTIEDADRLHHAIEQVARLKRSQVQVAIIGGGVLGVEIAASFNQMGLGVDLLVAGEHPWAKFAGETTGRFVGKFLQTRGIKLHTGPRPVRLDGDGRVQRIVLNDGDVVGCDFAVAAVGAFANLEILRGTNIRAEKAILVDDRCETSVSGIYAAGDCCAVFDPLFAKHRILDHWDNAMVTGTIAGTNMAGGEKRYDGVNSFFSDVFDWSLNAWGEARLVDRRLVRGTPSVDAPDFVEFGVAAGGRIAQVLSVNHKGEDELLQALVAKRVQVDGNEELLKDPAVDLKTLLG